MYVSHLRTKNETKQPVKSGKPPACSPGGDDSDDNVAPAEDCAKDAPAPATTAVTNEPPAVAPVLAAQGLPAASLSAPNLIVPTTEPTALAHLTVLLPLGNYAVIEVEGSHDTTNESEAFSGGGNGGGGDGSGGGGGGDGDAGSRADGRAGGAAARCLKKERKLLRLDDRVELVDCRGEMSFF